ncbi:hypothetical protein EI94DRAFT_112740 [Lactarius quietus]|nr:hypothetical protein EI94DRAFT_112740 [Lactarius quietus]
MPLDPLDGFPMASSSSKPYPNGEGAISGYHQAPPSALPNPHRVMGQYSQYPSLAFCPSHAQPCPCSSGPPAFVPRTCHSFTLAQAQASSHVYPPPPILHHHRQETTMNVVYDLTTSTQTSMTVLQTGFASSLAPDPHHSYAPTHYAPHNPPLVRSRLPSNGWQPPNTSSCHPFNSYVAPAPLPTSPVPSVPLFHPKPVHPLPEWTKKSSLVLDEFFCEETPNTDSPAILAQAVAPLPRGTDEYWNYGPPIANEQIVDPQDSSHHADDDDCDDDFDDEYDDDDEDYEYDDDDGTDMEEDFETEAFSGTDSAMPEFHATPSDRPAPFCGTLLSAAVPLSSSSLLCQPLPDFVQNQFRASAV